MAEPLEFVEDTDIYPTMLQLVACAQAENDRSGLPAVGYAMVQPGVQVVLDHVGNGKECAEIIVNMTTSYPVDIFPNPDFTGTCSSTMAYEVQLAIFRCSPQPKNGRAPSITEQLESTRIHLADKAAMLRAIQCCFQTQKRDYIVRSFLPYGPQGVVVGGAWLIVVGGPK